MKARATALLVLAGCLWLGVRIGTDGSGAWGYVESMAEAGMIGGLADWFAVTALFRHPLRIPIPHTAIIPRRKDEIGAALGGFVAENFLEPDAVAARLRDVPIAKRLGEWLEVPENAARVADRASGVRPVLGQALDAAIEDGLHVPLIEAALSGAGGMLEDNREMLRQRIYAESPRWVPQLIDDRVFDRAYRVVQDFLTSVRADPDHEVRHAIDARLRKLAVRFQEPLIVPGLDTAVSRAGQALATDPELQATVDEWMVSAGSSMAEQYGHELGTLIESTVARWDADDTSRRIEASVGRDLQYIRINGTVVGGLAGLAIHAVNQFIG